MECDLCKHEISDEGSLLCAVCAEAIGRLVAIFGVGGNGAAIPVSCEQTGRWSTRKGQAHEK